MNLKEEILNQTGGGIDVFEHYIPEVRSLNSNYKKKFKLRDEKTPSASLKNNSGVWLIQDFGNAEYEGRAKNAIDYVIYNQKTTFINACHAIIKDLNLNISYSQHSTETHYKKPEISNFTELTDNQLKYLREERKLSTLTIKKANLTTEKRYVSEIKKEIDCICFPYIDENGEIVNIKYRGFYKSGNKAKRYFSNTAQSKATFYGIHELTEETEEIIIVEGEIDKLTIDEVFSGEDIGNDICLSVPNGVNSLNSITTCWDLLKDVRMFYIFVDDDEAGKKLQAELCRRLGKEKCKVVPKKGGKDANEIFVKYGKEGIKECIEAAKYAPIDGEILPSMLLDKLTTLFKYGVPAGYTTGFTKLDNMFTWGMSQLTIITGIPQHGKSNWFNQILVKLVELHGLKGGFYSPEYGGEEFHIQELQQILIGKCYPIQRIAEYANGRLMNEDEFNLSYEFIKYGFVFTDIEKPTIENVISTIIALIRRYGLNFFVIDPFNRLTEEGDTKKFINRLLTELNRLKVMYNVHIVVIAHPTKMKKDFEFEIPDTGEKEKLYSVPTAYDISGSSDWYNQADNIITVYRNMITDDVTTYFQKVKKKGFGKIGYVDWEYDVISGRYTEKYGLK